jgi:RNA polymerase sigma factor (sigma-70 family)
VRHGDDSGWSPGEDIAESASPRLRALAYRLLGSAADAEDAVQETYLRWYALAPTARSEISMPAAWLSRTLSRICLDQLKSARARRERYVGPWLPEPVSTSGVWTSQSRSEEQFDPADRTTVDESISVAFTIVLETTTPAERVAFILHDVFQYPFKEIAEIIGRTPQACRQLASSARKKVARSRPGSASPHKHAEVVRAFKNAWTAGDVSRLVQLLDPRGTTLPMKATT